MRLFVSFILLSIVFASPIRVQASDNDQLFFVSVAKQFPAACYCKGITKPELAAEIKSGLQVATAAARAKHFASSHLMNAASVDLNSGCAAFNKYFVDRTIDHQPLALQLIFPKHYFW